MKSKIFIIFTMLLVSCTNSTVDNQSQVLRLLELLEDEDFSINFTEGLVIYYFDGDCSFCINKLIELSKVHNENLLAISKVEDPSIFRFTINEAKIDLKGRIVIVQNDDFEQILMLNNVYYFDIRNNTLLNEF